MLQFQLLHVGCYSRNWNNTIVGCKNPLAQWVYTKEAYTTLHAAGDMLSTRLRLSIQHTGRPLKQCRPIRFCYTADSFKNTTVHVLCVCDIILVWPKQPQVSAYRTEYLKQAAYIFECSLCSFILVTYFDTISVRFVTKFTCILAYLTTVERSYMSSPVNYFSHPE